MPKVTTYYLQMYLRILEINVLKYELDPAHFLSTTALTW